MGFPDQSASGGGFIGKLKAMKEEATRKVQTKMRTHMTVTNHLAKSYGVQLRCATGKNIPPEKTMAEVQEEASRAAARHVLRVKLAKRFGTTGKGKEETGEVSTKAKMRVHTEMIAALSPGPFVYIVKLEDVPAKLLTEDALKQAARNRVQK
jgi:hypothetical protein